MEICNKGLITKHDLGPQTCAKGSAGLWHRHCRKTARAYDVTGAYERRLQNINKSVMFFCIISRELSISRNNLAVLYLT